MKSGYIIFLLVKLPLFSVLLYTIIIILLCVDFYPNLVSSYSSDSSNQKLHTVGNNVSLPNMNNNPNLEILLISNSSSNKIADKLINLAKQTDDNNGTNTLKDFAVPIAVAIIGTTAALWNGFQAKWNGHHFQKLILRELGEFQPTNNKDKTDGNLKSYMNKTFMHEEILHNSKENSDLILSLDPKLIYLTNQLWSSFNKNKLIAELGRCITTILVKYLQKINC